MRAVTCLAALVLLLGTINGRAAEQDTGCLPHEITFPGDPDYDRCTQVSRSCTQTIIDGCTRLIDRSSGHLLPPPKGVDPESYYFQHLKPNRTMVALAYVSRAEKYSSLGKNDDADRDIAKAIALNPHHSAVGGECNQVACPSDDSYVWSIIGKIYLGKKITKKLYNSLRKLSPSTRSEQRFTPTEPMPIIPLEIQLTLPKTQNEQRNSAGINNAGGGPRGVRVFLLPSTLRG